MHAHALKHLIGRQMHRLREQNAGDLDTLLGNGEADAAQAGDRLGGGMYVHVSLRFHAWPQSDFHAGAVAVQRLNASHKQVGKESGGSSLSLLALTFTTSPALRTKMAGLWLQAYSQGLGLGVSLEDGGSKGITKVG